MANTREGNVRRIDVTDTVIADVRTVVGVKYIGAAVGTATIKGGVSGKTLWEHNGDVIIFDNVQIRCDEGIEVEVTGTAVVYIYEKV